MMIWSIRNSRKYYVITQRMPGAEMNKRNMNTRSLNNTLIEEDLENLETLNTNSPNWSPVVGNSSENEVIPEALRFRPRVPKLGPPPFRRRLSIIEGGRRRSRKAQAKQAQAKRSRKAQAKQAQAKRTSSRKSKRASTRKIDRRN